jgi:hypothetical protein
MNGPGNGSMTFSQSNRNTNLLYRRIIICLIYDVIICRLHSKVPVGWMITHQSTWILAVSTVLPHHYGLCSDSNTTSCVTEAGLEVVRISHRQLNPAVIYTTWYSKQKTSLALVLNCTDAHRLACPMFKDLSWCTNRC